MKIFSSLLLFVIVITTSDCAKILGIFNLPSQSHHILGESLLKTLAAKGHKVTMLSPFANKNITKNYNEILIPELLKGKDEMMKSFIKSQQQDSLISQLTATLSHMTNLENVFFSLPKIQSLINSGKQYDLAIAVYFGNDAVLALAQHLAKHTIVFSTLGSNYQITKLTKVPASPSYVPNLFPPFPDEMNFIARLQNFLTSAFLAVFDMVFVQPQKSTVTKYLPNSPSADEIYEHISLVLLNTHFSLESPRPYVPQMIQVGGLQLEESTELTGNLKKFMDDATEGAILFSLGSNVKSSELSKKSTLGIIKCFSKLPYKVFWKFEKSDTLTVPQNVLISNWLPQRDLLGHKNMKLFITHGGLLSTTEAIFNGVPMVGVPVFGDQTANVAESVSKGYAVTVPFLELSEEKLCNAISEVMSNSKYRQNIQKRSRLFKDQPVKPMEKAVFWVEYVLRHDGAHHLKTSAFKLHWLQQYSVDVISIICVIIFVIVYIVKKVLKCTWRTMKIFLSLLLFVIVITTSDCAKILGIFNMPSQSHHILGESLLKTLASKGHEVTMLSPFASKNLTKNYNEIFIPEILKGKDEMMKVFIKSQQHDSIITQLTAALSHINDLENVFFNLPKIQSLINSGKQYDLAIAVYFGNDAVLALAQHLAKHTIVFSTLGSHYQITKLTKVPASPSYVPNLYPPFPDEMNFIVRLQNFLTSAFLAVFDMVLVHQEKSTIHKYLPNSPSADEIYEHTSLVLLNTHFSLESPRPYVPQMIQVGGLQLEESTELTGNLKKIMDDATEGAILFSLGSNVKSSELSEKSTLGIINCFSKLPYKVLWKFEKSDTLTVPQNVIISNWLPQRDLLAHKNMKLFITHGGLLSTTEAVYNGVPMVGIPVFGDQAANVAESVSKGIAVTVPFLELSEEKLCSAISEVMNNSKYRQNIQKRSRVFKDQPVKPMEKAVFWVEYVLRHDGAHHLKTSAFKLHWLQLYSVDVISIICVIIVVFVYIVKKVLKCTCRCLYKVFSVLSSRKEKSKVA
ncbi:hypothetical protein FQR65_LT17760 [Abscondita terminalis]|nr:hypothetical protein FQR65_LT17760 [Abscondita terminalis]